MVKLIRGKKEGGRKKRSDKTVLTIILCILLKTNMFLDIRIYNRKKDKASLKRWKESCTHYLI